MGGRAPRGDSALAAIRRIRGVSWRWREDAPLAEISARGGEAQAGVIAQEVQAVFPDLVVTHESGYLMVDYAGLAQVLARALQELDARATELEGLSAPSPSDERAKAEVDPLNGALKHLGEAPGSLTSEDVQALVGALVEAVKALDARIVELERAAGPGQPEP
jgi:Chaperone of endosialidase